MATTFGAGDAIPKHLTLDLGFPPTKVNVLEHTQGKKIILMGLPGAYTPTWSARQIPGYLKAQDELKALGIEEIMLFCANDGAVMTAWRKDQKCNGDDSMINFYADPTSTFTNAAGKLMMDHPGPISVGLLNRCKRFLLYIEDGTVKYSVTAEDVDFDPAGDDFPEKVLPPQVMAAIKKVQQQ